MICIRDEPELIELGSSDEEEINDSSVIFVDLDESETIGSEFKVKNCEATPSPTDANSNVKSPHKEGSYSKPPFPSSSSSDLFKKTDKQIANVLNLNDPLKKQSVAELPTSNNSKNHSVSISFRLGGSEHPEVIVLDSTKATSSKKKKKRKRKGKKGGDNVECVEIIDDETIVIDDSMTISSPGNTSSASAAHTACSSNSLLKSDIGNVTRAICTSNISQSHSSTCHSSDLEIVNKVSENESEGSQVKIVEIASPPRKKSKLAYHRPAHLVTPLIRPTPDSDIPSTQTSTVTNIYNPNTGSSNKQSGLRPIVIDGNNVAISHGKGKFSLKGIQICVNFFEKRGHRQIKVFVPQYRKNKDTHDQLHNMERKGLVVITPSRKLNGKVVASYDDRYIVQYAAEFGGVIVSTDNFRDLMSENPDWKETIEKRLLMFTWIDDVLMFPQDPLGRNGPSLDEYLAFPAS